MPHPYQVTALCKPSAFAPEGLLLAGCGSRIVSVKLADGSLVAQWPEQKDNSANDTVADGPPGKKRKLEPETAITPNVIKLTVSPDQKYAVVVTDDKSVRVLEITETGKLNELSERMMPKRPCAVLVTPDNQTILCGDKFGDVYSLPLIPSTKIDQETPVPETKEDTGPKKYVPAASTLTVHSGRNRRALENQMKQKDLQAKSREGPKFEHQLLLGHVSMLTDVQFATVEVDGKDRNYIITTDRDEHIRVSRGPPQAHVVERFCLGHKEFVSKICVLPGNELLVSGGGDDWLGFWDWRAGDLKEKRDMRSALTNLLSSTQDGTSFGNNGQFAVSGIWGAPAMIESGGQQREDTAIVIACERLPCLLVTSQSPASSPMSAVQLPGTPLDVTVLGNSILVSTDVTEASSPRLQAYRILITKQETRLELDEELNGKLQAANRTEVPTPERKQLDSLLYGIENLRKRGNATEEGQDAPDE